jgi:hypothetical protein
MAKSAWPKSRACWAANASLAWHDAGARQGNAGHPKQETLGPAIRKRLSTMSLELVLITGMSGSGKSVALRALEDAGYFCVDNLPPELLLIVRRAGSKQPAARVAIAMDVRSATSLPLVPAATARAMRRDGVAVRPLFLDATTDTLVRRFSETRRRHPLSRQEPKTVPDQHRALVEAIELERELLADLRDGAHVIDTSLIRATRSCRLHQVADLSTPQRSSPWCSSRSPSSAACRSMPTTCSTCACCPIRTTCPRCASSRAATAGDRLPARS